MGTFSIALAHPVVQSLALEQVFTGLSKSTAGSGAYEFYFSI